MPTIQIIVSGQVQGVFFRHHTRETAKRLGINGYAKNLPNGDVEIVAKGNDEKLREFVEFCKKGPESAVVKKIKIRHIDSKEIFQDFQII